MLENIKIPVHSLGFEVNLTETPFSSILIISTSDSVNGTVQSHKSFIRNCEIFPLLPVQTTKKKELSINHSHSTNEWFKVHTHNSHFVSSLCDTQFCYPSSFLFFLLFFWFWQKDNPLFLIRQEGCLFHGKGHYTDWASLILTELVHDLKWKQTILQKWKQTILHFYFLFQQYRDLLNFLFSFVFSFFLEKLISPNTTGELYVLNTETTQTSELTHIQPVHRKNRQFSIIFSFGAKPSSSNPRVITLHHFTFWKKPSSQNPTGESVTILHHFFFFGRNPILHI